MWRANTKHKLHAELFPLSFSRIQALPFHYIELATDLCKYAREDLPDWSLSYDLMVLFLLLRCLFSLQNVTLLNENELQTTG